MESGEKKPILRGRVLIPALVGSVVCFLAFPPLGWWPLIFLGPLPWLLLVRGEELAGRRPYLKLWAAGILYWVLVIHWIRLPHPLNYLGLAILASYLGAYLPVFVFLSRVGVHRLRVPLWLAAPAVWVGLDWVRGHLFSGFLMGSLAHALYVFPPAIQSADLVGEYGVTFFVVFVAACTASWTFVVSSSRGGLLKQCLACLIGTAVIGFLFLMILADPSVVVMAGYAGNVVEDESHRIAIIQGNTADLWERSDEKNADSLREQMEVTAEAVAASQAKDGRAPDLIIWPECMYPYPYFTVAEGYTPPADILDEQMLAATPEYLSKLAKESGSPLLIGLNRYDLRAPDRLDEKQGAPVGMDVYNSAVAVDRDGAVVGVYDKMHRVPFGEYIPLAESIPWLYQFTPLAGGTTPGREVVAFELEGVTYSTSICYESTVPHLIRRQVRELAERGQRPDVLVNLTNDAWFDGASELEMHLACGVFRAVENRTPMVIAANGGLSAYISPSGEVLSLSKRQTAQPLLVEVAAFRDSRQSFYTRHGDWFAGACVLCCIVFASAAFFPRHARRPSAP